MDRSGRSRGRQGCCAVLSLPLQHWEAQHRRQAAQQAPNAHQTRGVLCLQMIQTQAPPPTRSPVPRSVLAVGVAAALLGVGLLLGNWWKSRSRPGPEER